MKPKPSNDICNLTSSGFHGQYVLWRGQLASTGFDAASIGTPGFPLPETRRAKSKKRTTAREVVLNGGHSKASMDGAPSRSDGVNGEGH